MSTLTTAQLDSVLYERFRRRLFEHIQDREVNKTELAQKCGISRIHLYRLANGEQNPQIENIEAIALALGFDDPADMLAPITAKKKRR